MALLVYNSVTEEEIWGVEKMDQIHYFGYLNTGFALFIRQVIISTFNKGFNRIRGD
jgi:hypothetical protein